MWQHYTNDGVNLPSCLKDGYEKNAAGWGGALSKVLGIGSKAVLPAAKSLIPEAKALTQSYIPVAKGFKPPPGPIPPPMQPANIYGNQLAGRLGYTTEALNARLPKNLTVVENLHKLDKLPSGQNVMPPAGFTHDTGTGWAAKVRNYHGGDVDISPFNQRQLIGNMGTSIGGGTRAAYTPAIGTRPPVLMTVGVQGARSTPHELMHALQDQATATGNYSHLPWTTRWIGRRSSPGGVGDEFLARWHGGESRRGALNWLLRDRTAPDMYANQYKVYTPGTAGRHANIQNAYRLGTGAATVGGIGAAGATADKYIKNKRDKKQEQAAAQDEEEESMVKNNSAKLYKRAAGMFGGYNPNQNMDPRIGGFMQMAGMLPPALIQMIMSSYKGGPGAALFDLYSKFSGDPRMKFITEQQDPNAQAPGQSGGAAQPPPVQSATSSAPTGAPPPAAAAALPPQNPPPQPNNQLQTGVNTPPNVPSSTPTPPTNIQSTNKLASVKKSYVRKQRKAMNHNNKIKFAAALGKMAADPWASIPRQPGSTRPARGSMTGGMTNLSAPTADNRPPWQIEMDNARFTTPRRGLMSGDIPAPNGGPEIDPISQMFRDETRNIQDERAARTNQAPASLGFAQNSSPQANAWVAAPNKPVGSIGGNQNAPVGGSQRPAPPGNMLPPARPSPPGGNISFKTPIK